MGKILDQYGNPFETAKIAEPQTAHAVFLRHEFETHPTRGLNPARLAAILRNAEIGDLRAQAHLFEDMEEKDAHIFAEMSKRKNAVVGLDWNLKPPRNPSAKEKKATTALETVLRDELDIETLVFEALDAVGHGYACLELEWRDTTVGKLPTVEKRPASWFTSPQDDRNAIHLRDPSSFAGVPLNPFGWIVHRHKSKSGYVCRSGLFRILAWPFLFKNYSIRDLAEFLEIYGLPMLVGKYPAGSSTSEKSTLMAAVASLGHNARGIMPEGMTVDIINAVGAGGGEPFRLMQDLCEALESKAILGGTLTSQPGLHGTQALGNVHNEVRLEIRDSDARQLANTLGRDLLYPIAMLNGWFDAGRVPTWEFDTQEPADLALYADAIPKLVSVGAKIPEQYLHDKLKIPPAEDGQAVLGMPTNPVQPTTPSVAAAKAGNPSADPTPVSLYTDQLADNASDSLQNWLDIIKARVDGADSLEGLRDDLLSMYGDLPGEDMVKVMQTAFACADLAGRFDVERGQ